MPCNCDHLESSNLEKELSKTVALLEELKTRVFPLKFGSGYLVGVYNKASEEQLEKTTEELCDKIQKIKDINTYSLELQMWWRDHQEADKERIETELKKVKAKEEQTKVLAKLTPYERELIGV